MGIQEAGDAPRIRHYGSSQPTGQVMTDGGGVVYESGILPEVVRELVARGHTIGKENGGYGGYGGYQGIWFDHEKNVLVGGSESRKDGCALGY